MLRRSQRCLCTKATHNPQQWSIKQVTKSNFTQTLEDLKAHISTSDFIAVSLQKTGSFSCPWHRVLPFDTLDVAYLKAKHAAERFQPLQFAVSPFSIRASNAAAGASAAAVVAYPYNFHIFPREEYKTGMPAYSFSYQTSYLTSMAQEGFDFNVCIRDGISYLSRSQESVVKDRLCNPMSLNHEIKLSSSSSVADAVFVKRIKSRVNHWRNACNESSMTEGDDVFVRSLRKIVMGSEQYRSRPCINIDVCSERQVQLTVEMLEELSDDLVALQIPSKDGGTQAVRVVMTKSKEDKDILEKELQDLEDEQNKGLRGFRDVIDLIAASQKPVVSYNSLNDFTFIYEKFLAPLPLNMNDFISSLRLVFPHILDLSHLMKEVGPMKTSTTLPAAIHNMRRQFFVPTDMEIPHLDDASKGKIHGNNVLRMGELFAKLCSVLKINPERLQRSKIRGNSNLESYTDIFTPCSAIQLERENANDDSDISVWRNSSRKVSTKNLVFLWGFKSSRTSAGELKTLLKGSSHKVFSEEFDVRLVDKSCAVIVFWQNGLSDTFLKGMASEKIADSLKEMASEGIRAASYETYKRTCSLGLWEEELADSLDKTFDDCSQLSTDHGDNDSLIYLDDQICFDDL